MIPVPPNKENRDWAILKEISINLEWRLKPENIQYSDAYYYTGTLSWNIINELTAAGYSVIPRHGMNIPANDWRNHIDSIYYWRIGW